MLVSKDEFNNKSTSIQVMAWGRTNDDPVPWRIYALPVLNESYDFFS